MATPCYDRVIYGPVVSTDPSNETQNAIIPLTGKHTLNSKVIYGDDEVQPLYVEHTLDLETIIYEKNQVLDDMEAEVERLRSILQTPSLQLLLYPVGLGEVLAVNVQTPDVKGGPFPQNTFVQPFVSNNAILIKWSVLFRTVDCTNPLSIPLLQYNVEQDMDVDDDGDMVFTVNITYQVKDPITNPQDHHNLTNLLIQNVDMSFQGMTKTKRTSLSRDQRIMSIRLVYKEIKSDNAYFPHTSNVQVDDTIESTLLGKDILAGKGFYSWRRSISGTINLPARIHKGYAWVVVLKILRARFKKLYPFSKIAALFDTTPSGTQDNSEEYLEHHYYLPTRIKITNPIYTRSLRFDITYIVTSDLLQLLNNTKLLARVNTGFTGDEEESEPTTLSEQWSEWQESREHQLNGRFQYEIDGTPIVYNQCSGVHSDHAFGSNRLLDLEDDPDWDTGEGPSNEGSGETDEDTQVADAAFPENVYGNEAPEVRYSWLDYKNKFEIVEDPNIVSVSYLEEPSSTYYLTEDAGGVNADRGVIGMRIHGKNSNSSQSYPNITIQRGASTFFVLMKGYALRLKYKIPAPFIVSVGGNLAKRVKANISQEQVGVGDIPTYLCMWSILYVIEGGDIYSTDILNSIITSGAPAHYS